MSVMKRPTLQDVARAAQVSWATASRVLNNSTTYPIADKTRQRVLDTARELRYRPSTPAIALQGKRTFEYGLAVQFLAFSYMPDVMEGLQTVANDLEYACLLYVSHNDAELERRYLDNLVSRCVDGIIWMPAHVQAPGTAQLVKHLPTVQMLYRSTVPDIPAVLIDQQMGGYLAAHHLYELGHRRIAYLRRSGLHWDDRVEGYKQLLQEVHIEFDPALVEVTSENWDRLATAYEKIMALEHPPTAIIAPSDAGAWGLLDIAQKHGHDVPNDVSIVGFGNTDLALRTRIPLTTIDHPKREVGQQAMQMLSALMADEPIADTILQPRLICRQSTSPPYRRP
jgi:DNA-binding LacI/PurR family transcriptional regulator